MLNIDKDLDTVLSFFFDEKRLLSNRIVSTNLLILNKYNLNYSYTELIVILDLLVSDGYLVKTPPPYEDAAFDYYITSKGVVKYLNGGFEKEKKIINSRNKLSDYGQIAIIIAAVYYLFEIIKQLYNFKIFLSPILRNLFCG
jgi:hypothetical protein